jgi:hypothetical protein
MRHIPFLRFAIASVAGLAATAVFFMLVAFLNGVFFEEKETLTVTPCFFGATPGGGQDEQIACADSQVDDSGIARMFKLFVPKDSVSPAEQAVRDFKARQSDDNR